MNAIKHWMLPVLMLLCAAGLNTACDELLNDEKKEGGSVETEMVQNPTKIQHYDGSTPRPPMAGAVTKRVNQK